MKEEKVEVSIICLAYNHEKYISKALDSFLMQKTNFKYEIIVHDDASTDDTADIIRQYEKSNPEIVKPIYQKENQHSMGKNIHREFTLKKAKGRFIALCEGDDFWTDEYKLQKQYNALNSNENCCFCVGLVNCCDKDGKMLKKTYPQDKYGINRTGVIVKTEVIGMLYKNSLHYPFQTSSYLFKREVFIKSLDTFNSTYDRNVLLAGVLCGDFYYINEGMSMYRRFTENSWTSRAKQLDTKKKNNMKIEHLKYDVIFNEVTNYRYNDIIMSKIYNDISYISKTSAVEAKRIFEENNGNYVCMLKNIGIIDTIIFFLSIEFPSLMNFLRKKKGTI